jgi:carboxypeptidase C (cathepsin A)
MDHLNLTPDLRKNISYASYPCGHMVYLQLKSLEKMHGDFGEFVESTLQKGP